jgi:Protein of unknown function (DUF3043)
VRSLFRRKSAEADLVAEATDSASAEAPESTGKRFTPSKRELGVTTPKRPGANRRAEAPAADRREQAKRDREKQKALREAERADRVQARKGMVAGDERYMLPRDRGPERALVRDIVDSRRTIGTFFFGVTFVVMLVGFNRAFIPQVYLAANLLFLLFAAGTLVDSVFICRQVRKLVLQRFPKTTQRMGSLYFYAVMRAISFRFIRTPKPRVKPGAQI